MKIALITRKYPRLNRTFIQREINGRKKAGAKTTVFSLYDVDNTSFSNKNILSTFENEQFLKRVPYEYEILKIVSAYHKSSFLDFLKFLYITPKILKSYI